jgi:hypothetical protein
LKSIAQANSKPSEWPEFREYVRRKYPELDEDCITMVQDIIEHPPKGKEQKQATDCPIGLDKVHCQNCYYWRDGNCDYKRIMEERRCQEHPPKG